MSLSTAEQIYKSDKEYSDWANFWSHSVYILPEKQTDMAAIRAQLGAIASEENSAGNDARITLDLQPLHDIVVGNACGSRREARVRGPHLSPVMLWILAGLAGIVILSACFNYTNLSIARAMRRVKEIGLRKAIGAGRRQVRMQFLSEAVMISLAALVLSFGLFLLLRPMLISMAPEMQQMVKLEISLPMAGCFILFSLAVGVVAGMMPAVFYAKVSPASAFGGSLP